MHGTDRKVFVSLGLVGLLALSACAPNDDENGAAGTEETEVETVAAVDEDEDAEEEDGDELLDEDDDENASLTEGEDEDDADSTGGNDVTHRIEDAQQTVTYPLPAADGEMTMGVQNLEAGEQGLLLEVTFVADYEPQDENEPMTMYELHAPDGATGHNAYLLPVLSDRENLKAYYVPTPEERHRAQGWTGRSAEAWATQLEGSGLTPGEPFSMWAYFPLPEDDIDGVDVAVMPGAQDFRDIEIDWGDQQPADSEDGDTDEDSEADDDGEEGSDG